MNDDELLFSDEDIGELDPPIKHEDCWKILIVDDEPEVHQITELTLVNFQFENRGLEFLHAYSAREALPIIKQNSDIALIFLDVVMESNHAGLELVQKIRNDLNNFSIRIVLRTGQPGEAPERDIIANYDINDYAEKADLSAQKLFTLVIASLRGYRDILKLENSRKELLLSNQHLLQERERIQVTLDSIGDAVITTDAAGHVTHLNPVAEAITGWSLKDVIGMSIKEIFPIVDASTGEVIDNPVDKVLRTGETVYLSNHTTLISKSGQRFQIADSAAPIQNVEQEILGMVLVFHDVTEQYALREENNKSRRNLQMIMDFTPAIIYAKDIDGCYLFVNKMFETVFNKKNKDVIGRDDSEILPAEYALKYQQNDRAVLAAGKAVESEEEAPFDDEIHQYLSVKFPLFDDAGDAYATCGILTDITERKKQEEQLRRSQKMEAIGQLTGGIAHDFNNQLGVIIGYLDFLSEHNKEDKEASKWLTTCTNATLRCTDLTRQLLSFSRTKSSEASVVDINACLSESETMYSRSVTPAIEIQYFLSDDLWLTEISSGEFQDAMLNLVINARDAMSNGGTLLIETSNKYIDEDYVALNPGSQVGEYIQIILSDTGIGMDAITQEKIFEPFYTTKPKGKGTGLGMSMVYGFMRRFDGFIKIYSELNVGTTMRLYLPRTNTSDIAELKSFANEVDLPRGSESILIVDDEKDLLHLAEKYLQELGYKTYLAENAQQALKVFSEHSDINCLFSDIVMPGGMNGYELAEQLTQQQPQLKVLLSTGFTSKAVAKNGAARFVDELLNKPYRKAELARRIRFILDGD